MYFIGIDIGTHGARVLITNEHGDIISNSSSDMEGKLNIFKTKDLNKNDIKSICIDGTSGTVLPIDYRNTPLIVAIMYKDNRSTLQAEKINKVACETIDKLGYKFNATFALAKILWIKENKPEIYRKTKYFIHQTDYIVGKLTSIFNISDHSNSLKTGFDLINYQWPDYIEKHLKIDKEKLPKVIKPGETIANINAEIADEFNLNKNTIFVAGMTDSTAALFASGANLIGDFNSVIGTTLALKGITREIVKDKFGVIYCHLHPEGYWLPGGASSTGGECLEVKFKGENFEFLDKKITSSNTSGLIIYPLVSTGERFPFYNNHAREFIIGSPKNKFELYKGYLESVGLVERLCYETIENLGVNLKNKIYITGGGARSNIWSKIRANILNKILVKPKIEETAMGAAIIAASKTYFKNVTQATQSMVKIENEFHPDAKVVKKYNEIYLKFKEELLGRNYI